MRARVNVNAAPRGMSRSLGSIPALRSSRRERHSGLRRHSRNRIIEEAAIFAWGSRMTGSPWQQRIRRAQELGAKYTFASQILRLYVAVALFQESLHRQLREADRLDGPFQFASYLAAPSGRVKLESFSSFLNMIKKAGPPALARIASGVLAEDKQRWAELLNQCWQPGVPSSGGKNPEQLLARAFLQPLAELARERCQAQTPGSTHWLCPLCGRKPGLAVLRAQGDGGRRCLICSLCLTEWDFRRIVCAGCGEEDHSRLPVYVAEAFDYIRVECCDTCKQYIKAVDLARNGLAEPVVDEIAAAPLDLWALERGYSKIELNLMGM